MGLERKARMKKEEYVNGEFGRGSDCFMLSRTWQREGSKGA